MRDVPAKAFQGLRPVDPEMEEYAIGSYQISGH
jgi:hypothetical protein